MASQGLENDVDDHLACTPNNVEDHLASTQNNVEDHLALWMKTDPIRTDNTDITFVFIFLSGFGFEYG
jgi:hypothetical protein